MASGGEGYRNGEDKEVFVPPRLPELRIASSYEGGRSLEADASLLEAAGATSEVGRGSLEDTGGSWEG